MLRYLDTLRSLMWSLIVHESRWGVTIGCGDIAEIRPYKLKIESSADASGLEQFYEFLGHLGYQVETEPVKILNPNLEPEKWLLDHDPDDEEANGFKVVLER